MQLLDGIWSYFFDSKIFHILLPTLMVNTKQFCWKRKQESSRTSFILLFSFLIIEERSVCTYESVNPYKVFRCCFRTNNIRQPCDAVMHSCRAVVSSGKRFNNDSSSSSSSSSNAFEESWPGLTSGCGRRDCKYKFGK